MWMNERSEAVAIGHDRGANEEQVGRKCVAQSAMILIRDLCVGKCAREHAQCASRLL